MTDGEALALITSSAPFKKAGGNFRGAWLGYAALNPRGADWLLNYAAGSLGSPVPTGVSDTLYGRGMRHLVSVGKSALVPTATTVIPPAPIPPDVTPPRPVVKAFKAAMVVNAGACSTELLRQAGLTHIAVELNEANSRDVSTGRWSEFTMGWFVISRGNDGDYIANTLDAVSEKAAFAIVDTESHKTDIGGSLAWTETLYAACRSKLGPGYTLFDVTFGVHSSPAVVNHEAKKRHNVTYVGEAYDGDGKTLGVDRTARKMISEGWNPPHIAIGDKSIPLDAAAINSLGYPLGSVWVWAVEQSGTDVLALEGVL